MSHLEQNACRRLDGFLDPLQEGHRLAPIDETMIVGQREVHHGANDDLTLAGNGSLLNCMEAEDAALRRALAGGTRPPSPRLPLRDPSTSPPAAATTDSPS